MIIISVAFVIAIFHLMQRGFIKKANACISNIVIVKTFYQGILLILPSLLYNYFLNDTFNFSYASNNDNHIQVHFQEFGEALQYVTTIIGTILIALSFIMRRLKE
jgi:hypothetical protein